MDPELQKAVETLCKALREDPELYYSYQANIAMAFKDEYRTMYPGPSTKNDREVIHAIANTAAKNFLNLLIREPHADQAENNHG